jgi:hypothetical protein
MIKRFKKEINILKIAELDHWMVTNLKKYNKISILTVVLAHKDMNLENKTNYRFIKMDELGVILAS